ncbi:MAG: hypothetical protein JSS32_02495 [Verrucomicrobia bacterium]|nr:hypothetical protein [Verrucomicrobiota bacterium]
MSSNSCCMGVGKVFYHVVFPYGRALHHVSEAMDKMSEKGCLKGGGKSFFILGGTALGGGLFFGYSPKIYEAFLSANTSADDKTSVFTHQTSTGLKAGAVIAMMPLAVWSMSFGAMMGGEIYDVVSPMGECLYECAADGARAAKACATKTFGWAKSFFCGCCKKDAAAPAGPAAVVASDGGNKTDVALHKV